MFSGHLTVHSRDDDFQLHTSHPSHHANPPSGRGQGEDRRKAVPPHTPTLQAGVAGSCSASEVCTPGQDVRSIEPFVICSTNSVYADHLEFNKFGNPFCALTQGCRDVLEDWEFCVKIFNNLDYKPNRILKNKCDNLTKLLTLRLTWYNMV